jgi:hypothetical protein
VQQLIEHTNQKGERFLCDKDKDLLGLPDAWGLDPIRGFLFIILFSKKIIFDFFYYTHDL